MPDYVEFFDSVDSIISAYTDGPSTGERAQHALAEIIRAVDEMNELEEKERNA